MSFWDGSHWVDDRLISGPPVSSPAGWRSLHLWLAVIAIAVLTAALISQLTPGGASTSPLVAVAPTSRPTPSTAPAMSSTHRPIATPILGAMPTPVRHSTPTPRLTAPIPRAKPTPTPRPVKTLPSSIDPTGSSDVSAQLNAFVKSVADGSTIAFKTGATYRLDRGVILQNRHNLVFDGNGATLRIAGCSSNDSGFRLDDDAGITIRHFKIIGDNSGAGTASSYKPGCEFQAGVALLHATNVEISNVLISNVWGDCLFVDQAAGAWSDGVWFHDSTCQLNGRQGVTITAGRHVTVERVTFDRLSRNVLDIEPYATSGGGTNITFRGNTVTNYGTSRVNVNTWYLFTAFGGPGSVVRDVAVTANTVTGGTLRAKVEVDRSQNIVVTNNTGLMSAKGPVLIFKDVDGVTVTGNRQALISGILAQFPGCTHVTYR